MFVGAGISRRYYGLDGWEGLLRCFAEEVGKPYEYYKSQANNNLPEIASLIAKDFHKVWWESDRFKKSRAENLKFCVSDESALKIEVCQRLSRSAALTNDHELKKEMGLLSKVSVDGIITTNYDPLLEILFPGFTVYVGQDQLIFNQIHGVAEIYKIHGSIADPNSIVLTQKDYDVFEDRSKYLAAKLLTMMVEHPVIFLGYSMGDPNVKQIMRAIAACLTKDHVERLRDRLIFVEWEPGRHLPEITNSSILIEDHFIPIKLIRADKFDEIFGAIGAVKRKFSAKILRMLKEHVYELVLSNDAKGSLFVQDIDKADSEKPVDVVFGVGVVAGMSAVGYKRLTTDEIIQDVLGGVSRFDAEKILTDTLPDLLNRKTSLVPVFRYLREAGRISADGDIKLEGLSDRVRRASERGRKDFLPPATYVETTKAKETAKLNFADLVNNCDFKHVMEYGTMIDCAEGDLDGVREYLLANYSNHKIYHSLIEVGYRKWVCYYDFLKYGPK